PHHPASSPRVAARARWTRRRSSARSPPVPIGAGWGSAISVPTDTPTAAPGASCIAPAVAATSRRPMAPRCTASAWRPRSWCGRWARCVKGWAFVRWPGVFEVDPNTVLAWLVEVADHATAFSRYFLHDVRVTQVQLDELFALLSAVQAGEVS